MSLSQGVAVLGIALIAMGEEIGSEMALRTFGHLVSRALYCQFSVLVDLMCCCCCCLLPSHFQPVLDCHWFSVTCSNVLNEPNAPISFLSCFGRSHGGGCLCDAFRRSSTFSVFLSRHQLRYGEPTLRRAVPLALALISVSNPRLNILDTLSKFSHDADPEVSHNSIFAMGMVGSGKSCHYR